MANTITDINDISEEEYVDDGKNVRPNIYNLEQNYANSNKWYAYFPLEDVLGKQFKNLNLHITRFSIPQLDQNSSEVTYRGYSKEIPQKVLNPSTKQFTIDYIVDADWTNYTCLYSFMSGMVGVINPIATDISTSQDTISATSFVPLRIYLLSPYKKKIIQFYFTNCWIKSFGDLNLDVNDPNEVTHSFTCVFEEFKIEKC